MNRVKLNIIYQVIFHYRIPFYNQIEEDNSINSLLIYGNGLKKTKLKNSKNSLKNKLKVKSKSIPFAKGKKFTYFPSLYRLLKKNKPDILLVEGFSSIINFLISFLYAKLNNKKIILWSLGKVQGKRLSIPRKIIDRFLMSLENNVDAVFTYSSLGENYFLNRGVSKEKIFKAINVVDTRYVFENNYKKAINHTNFKIIFVGSIIEEKKIEILLNAFHLLSEKYTNVSLEIIGSGDEYFDNLIKNYNSYKGISFLGRVTEGLEKYYLNADVFVLPGLGGLAISESMAYGVPVICSRADGTELDLIQNDNNGYIIPDIDPRSLFLILESLYNDRSKLERLSKNASHTIKHKYNFNNYYQEFKNCLKFVYES